MASFLFAATAVPGHVNPALPIVRALVDAGHDVRFATGAAFEAAVTVAGARFVPVPPDADPGDQAADPARQRLSGPRQIRYDLVHSFTAPAGAQARHLLGLLSAEPADALVADTAYVAGRLVREVAGLPVAYWGISVFPYSSRDVAPFGTALGPARGPVSRVRNRVLGAALRRFVAGPTTAVLDRQRGSVGLPARKRDVLEWDEGTGLYLQLSPAGFDYPRSDLPAVVHAVGMPDPLPPAGWTPPAWWDEGPFVVVTQGTIAMDPGKLLRPALAGLAGEDVRVVAITGGAPADTLAPVPPNAHVEPFVPYGPLFSQAAAVVTNGGFGGVQTALAHGVPVVVAGRTEDKAEVGARVAWSGVGIDLRADRPTPAAVRDGVREVLSNPAYAERARLLAATAPADLAAARAVELLAALATTGQAVVSPR